jgi:hypothetical protein
MAEIEWLLAYNSKKLDNFADALDSHSRRLIDAPHTPLTVEEARMIRNDLMGTIAIIRMNQDDVEDWIKKSKKTKKPRKSPKK